ncbi:MAG: VWA domain-containing protein [Myxococcales bacterium]|nr:VWA domain-containing protein [Myxococcales bacterium]
MSITSAWRTAVISIAVLLAAPAAFGADPLRAQVSRCIPIATASSSTGVLGETATLRTLDIQFGWATRSAVDNGDKAGALQATTRLEVCRVSTSGSVDCPASKAVPNLDWLVFDDSTKPTGKPSNATWVKSFGDPGAHEYFAGIPIDYEAASNAGSFLFLKVNNENVLSALSFGGWCPLVQPLDQAAKFRVLGVPATIADPFGGLFGDVCTEGNKSGANETQACIDAAGSKFVADRMPAISDWQENWLFQFLPTPKVTPPVWANGTTKACAGQYCPTLVWTFAQDIGAHGGLGQFFLQPGALSSVNADLSLQAGDYLAVMGHEFFHNLQAAWQRAYGTTHQGDPSMAETAPVGVDAFMCLFNYPGVNTNQCVSSRKLGSIKGSVENTNNWLLTPNSDPVTWNYVGSVFWRYLIEQYSMPLGDDAHPSGSKSAIEATNPNAPLGSRRSDEGSDLLGRVFHGIKDAPNDSALDVIDTVLTKELHRGLDAAILDMHTAALLKDYSTSDKRWYFQWVGDANAGAASALVPGAPTPASSLATFKGAFGGKLPVPPDLVGTGLDYLRRTKRDLDNYSACTGFGCSPARVSLLPGQGFASNNEVTLQPFGTALLSVHPGAGLGLARVRLVATKSTKPRFRIFLVKTDGVPKLVPGCNLDPDGAKPAKTGMCELDATGTFDVPVPASGYDEVLVVASAGRTSASFKWLIGDVDPRLEILDPLKVRPAQIGNALEPRPFIAQFLVRDENNEPMGGLAPGNFKIRAPKCAGPKAPTCDLVNGTDFEVTKMGSGLYWALGQVPASFYPATLPGALDLVVSVDVLGTGIVSDTESDALAMTAAGRLVTQFVLDRSGSMNDFGKLKAMQDAAKLLGEAMIETDEVGLVTFNNDAQTIIGGTTIPFLKMTPLNHAAFNFAVDQITALGWTSIGDGVLEGQSNLAVSYGNAPPADVHLHMIVLSDGLNNAGWEPRRYYLDGFTPDTNTDGEALPPGDTDPDPSDNLPWYSGNLAYWQRQGAGQRVPIVSAIAIGKDADTVELKNLADVGGGVFAYSYDDPPTPPPSLETLHRLEFADAFRTAMNRASGHDRVLTTRPLTPAPDDLPPIQVEPGARELLVSLLSTLGDPVELGFRLRLVAPNGQKFAAVQVQPGLVFKIAQPAAGQWTWKWEQFGTPPPEFVPLPGGQASTFVEAAVRGAPVNLFARVSPTHERSVVATANATENGSWVGLDIVIRAAALERLPLRGVSIKAEVESPSGVMTSVQLPDDGDHGDGGAEDGLHAVRYFGGTEPGVYRIRITASGLSSNGQPFTREQWQAVELHAAPDTDGDGIPDWWEIQKGTDPAAADSDADPDDDGLSNREEFLAHTDPLQSDTDGGGESDGSEAALGLDPHDGADDTRIDVRPVITPCNSTVLITAHAPRAIDGATLMVASAPTRTDPFGVVASKPLTETMNFTIAAANDQPACYRSRVLVAGHASPWSGATCVTPRFDPSPPSVGVQLTDGRNWTRTRRVMLRVQAGDEPSQYQGHQPVCADVASTGTPEMMIATRSDFAGAVWQAFSAETPLQLEDAQNVAVWVKVRDGAGNESAPAALLLRIVAQTDVDEAISLEERSLDRIDGAEYSSARNLIVESLTRIGESKARMVKLVVQEHDKRGATALVSLEKIAAQKTKAWALLQTTNKPKAREAIEAALELERDLARWAENEGIKL